MEENNQKNFRSPFRPSNYEGRDSAHSSERTLFSVLKLRSLTPDEAFRLLDSCVVALAELHASGNLHRNIKPSSIILTSEKFSGVSFADSGAGTLDSNSSRYCSPEILGNIGAPITAASDIYSLGIVLTEALTGKNPLQGKTLREIVLEQMVTKIPDVRCLGIRVPRAFAEILLRMMMKDPDARYQSAGAIRDDLRKIRDQLGRGVLDPAIAIGHTDIRTKLAEPSLTGFENQIALMDTCLTELKEGNGRIIFLEAESGGGKSRLLEEIKIRAKNIGLRTFHAQGSKETVEHPYESVSGILSEVLTSDAAFAGELRKSLTTHKDSIIQIFPRFESILGERSYLSIGPESMGESRSLEAISALFKALGSREIPALIIIDDGQWVDHLTLKLIEQLSNDELKCVSVIFSYRGEENPLKNKVGQYIKLEPFTAGETAKFARSMTGPLPSEATQHLFKVSRGNPFLIFAELHAMITNGTLISSPEGWILETSFPIDEDFTTYSNVIPKNLLSHLDDETMHILKQAAVIGKRFTQRELEGLAEMAGSDIALKLSEAEKKHLVVRVEDDYVFFHDKIREALLQDINSSFKIELHRKLALKLDASDPNNVFRLAYHLDAAEEHVQALPFAIMSGDLARERSALELSEQYFHMARKGIVESTTPQIKRKIYENLSELFLLQGKYVEADEALSIIEHLNGTSLANTRILSKKAELLFKQGKVQESIHILEEALTIEGKKLITSKFQLVFGLIREIFIHLLLRTGLRLPVRKNGREALVAKLYVQLGYAYYFTNTHRSIWALFRLLNHCESHALTTELAQAYSNYGVFYLYFPFDKGALWAIRKSLEIRTKQRDQWGEGQSLHFLGSVHYVSNRYQECIRICREARKRLKVSGDHWEYNDTHCIEAMAMYRLGQLSEAIKTAKLIYKNADLIGDAHSCAFALSVWSAASGGDVPEELISRQMHLLKSDLMSRSAVVEAEALRLLSRGEYLKAIRILEEIGADVKRNKIHIEYVSGVKMLLVTAIRKYLETLHVHNHDERSIFMEKLRVASKEAMAWSRAFTNNKPVALREAGLLESLEGRPRQAILLLEKSLKQARSQKAVFECGKTLLELEKLDPRKIHASELRRSFPAANVILKDVNGIFEISASERPITLALSDRFDGLLEIGRKVVLAQTIEQVKEVIGDAAVQLLRIDSFIYLDKTQEILKLREFGFQTTLKTPQSVHPNSLDDLAKLLKLPKLKSVLLIPVAKSERHLDAVIILGHSEVSEHFGEEDSRIANFLSSLASASLENIDAFHKIQEAVKIRDEFVGLSCHELRTPLTSLTLQMGMIKRLLQKKEQSSESKLEKIDKFIDGGEKQLGEFTKLVERLLSSTILDSGINDLKREPVELVGMVKNVVQELMPKFHETFTPVVVNETGAVKGHWDAKRLIEVIQNLLTNALKYGSGRPVIIYVRSNGEWATLSVKDSGIGISLEDQKKIFERYSRAVSARHFGGLGLGLYLTQKIVEAHGGEISVESMLGSGSLFTVKLPLKEI